MFKEKHIIAEYPFTKTELVAYRASDKYKEGIDWIKEEDKTFRRGAFCWTMKGMIALLASKGLEAPKVEAEVAILVGDPTPDSPVVAKPAVSVPKSIGIVKRIYPNRRLIDCEIRGQKHRVKVWDNRFMKLGTFIDIIENPSGYVSTARFDVRGRPHGEKKIS